MKFSCKSGMIFLLLSTSAFSGSKSISHYTQLVEALRQGDNVHAIIELDKCKPVVKGNTPTPDMTGAMTRINFDVFSYYKVLMPNGQLKYAVATSMNTLTEHRQFGAVQGYARLRVFEDDAVEFHLAHFDPRTYEQKSDVNYVCQLENGVKLFDATS